MLDVNALNQLARDYVAGFNVSGVAPLISNLNTSVTLFDWGQHHIPMTINDGVAGRTFVCSPRVAYVDYTLEELDHFPDRRLAPLLRGVVRGVGAALSLSSADRIVHVNNWMLSTTLPIGLDPALAQDQTRRLVEAFPNHFLAIRSLNGRHEGPFLRALEAAGWQLLPSRQVFLIDDLQEAFSQRRDLRRDEALWQKGDFLHEDLAEMTQEDARRLAHLYQLLYLEKYSALNPAFSEAFFRLTHKIGLIHYRVLRDKAAIIQGFCGVYTFGRYATAPILGYNTSLPQSLGLYRLSFHSATRYALERGLQFNLSSGATQFKRNRGASAEMEYTAYYYRHLAGARRAPFWLLKTVAQRLGEPLLRKYDL
ncbi:hypothetical protein [Asticcacaulis sp.]|uniref:hypothetical protein n=1 Tax=Asticcacaulis sp. TaxID=1872648 RepID=UPI0031E45AA6